jgi:hypothetical protein
MQPNRQTYPGNIELAYRHTNVGTGNEAAKFQFWEHIIRIVGTLYYVGMKRPMPMSRPTDQAWDPCRVMRTQEFLPYSQTPYISPG